MTCLPDLGLRSGHLLAAFSLAFAASLAIGCGGSRETASSRYRQVQDKMVYQSTSMNLGRMFPSGGLSRDPSVRMSGWATCPGENCRPERAWLSFVLRGPSRSNVLSNRTVQIKTDTEVHRWPENRQRFPDGLLREGNNNELTRIRMTLSTLRDIAASPSGVNGQIGQEKFSLSYDALAPLRAMLEKIDQAGATMPS